MNRKRISSAISPLLGLLSTLVLSVNIEAQVPRKAQIAFVSGRDGNSEIYVMDTNGKNQRNLTTIQRGVVNHRGRLIVEGLLFFVKEVELLVSM